MPPFWVVLLLTASALTGTVDGYFDGAGGADTLVFGAVTGASGSATTILGGEGNDTLGSTEDFAYVSLVGGAGVDSIYTAGSGDNVTNSTMLGGDGDDTLHVCWWCNQFQDQG